MTLAKIDQEMKAERSEMTDDSDPRPRFEVLIIDETTASDRD